MTRILSYNILVGGTGRIEDIEGMIRLANPDVVGLVEAINPAVVETLANHLDMDYRTNASPDGSWQTSSALLSRLPIVRSEVHARPGVLNRPLLEVGLKEAHGETLTAFVAHLTADFAHGRGGDVPRRKEVHEILRVMRANHGPHVMMGDFNALAPGDKLKASHLLRYLMDLDKHRKHSPQDNYGRPYLNFVVPPQLRMFNPLLYLIPRSQLLCDIFDEAGSLYAPRGSIGLLRMSGYVDCFRYVNPRAWGFTCPSSSPAGRIDYLFANPLLATRLTACKVVNGDQDVNAEEASDHLPIMADFGVSVEPTFKRLMDDRTSSAKETIGEPI
ncbi:MAG: endonuclease/exonuclease/phosphatase family protein [Ktedonobacteraceae bacterium]